MNKLHILIIPSDRYFPPDNHLEGIFQKDQAEALAALDLNVGVLSIEPYGLRKLLKEKIFFLSDKTVFEKKQNINICRIQAIAPPARYLNLFRLFWLSKGKKVFKQYIKKYGKPDIIHAHNVFNPGLLAAKLKGEFNIPFIITEHSSQFIKNDFSPLDIQKIKGVFDNAEKIISVSPSLLKLLNNIVSIQEKAIVIPNTLSKNFSNIILEDTKETEKTLFFSLARLTKTKGFYELLKAFADVYKGNKLKKLVIGGCGQESEHLLLYANKLGIKDQVEFTGLLSKEDVKQRMLECNVFVLASHFETFGVVFIEALACGKPVIGTYCGGPEYIINETNGILVESENSHELADALLRMSKNYLSYNSQKIRDDCLSNYGLEKIGSSLYDVYSDLNRSDAEDEYALTHTLPAIDTSIDYLVKFDIELQPGVAKKIKQTIRAFEDAGYKAQYSVISSHGLHGYLTIFKYILTSKSDVLILRNTLYSMSIIAPFLLVKRVLGQTIIIDIPTPIVNALDELEMLDISRFEKKIRAAIIKSSFPWALYPAHKILQYSKESSYFLFGIRNKTKLIANGIDVDSIVQQRNVPLWPVKQFIMIGVASLASWHGFDRVIRGIAEYYKNKANDAPDIEFLIVGDGLIRSQWEQLVTSLKLTDHIKFLGYLSGADLNNAFENVHIGISSIGAFRKGLSLASDLKSREYAARGIPFLSSVEDPDFSEQTEFVLKVKNDNSPIVILDVINWYSDISRKKIPGSLIRNYAEENLDFHVKIKTILAGVS